MLFVQGDGGHASVVIEVAMLSGAWEGAGAFIAVGDNGNRKAESERLAGMKFVRLIHPSAVVSRTAEIGEGTIVMAGAVIQAHAKIGKHCIINTNAVCDHHTVVGDFAHIAPGVHLCGAVVVGEGALVGVGACAVPGAQIKPWSLVKAGGVAL